MEESTAQDNRPTVAHNMVLVHLAASRFLPGHINPDFLRFNEIVDPAWQVELPVIIEAGFSQVAYSNGISVSAGEDHFRVAQSGQPLSLEEISVSDVFSRYLAVTPWLAECKAIVTEWQGSLSVSGESAEPTSSPIYDLGKRANFSDIVPEIQVRVSYDFADRNIALFVSETKVDNLITEIQCRALVFRNMESLPAEGQGEFIRSVLGRLDEDINGFVELVTQFYFG